MRVLTSSAAPSVPLAFTGERFTPECVREMWYEHFARYAMARSFVAGKRVLDAACGEGYGSVLLAQTAQRVLGLDLSPAAVNHASLRYSAANLSFDVADVTALQLAPGTFDVAVSFETLEHVAAHDAMLRGLKSALTADGVLLVSSPDRHTYSDLTGYRNEFHVKELYRTEFEALLSRHFKHFRLFGQKLLFQSAIWDLSTPPTLLDSATQSSQGTESGLHYAPLYFIAVASDSAEQVQNAARKLWLYGDQQESVYSHYNDEIRKGIRAGGMIQALEAQIAQLQTQLAAKST